VKYLCLLLACLALPMFAQEQIFLSKGLLDSTKTETLGLQMAGGMETHTIFLPTDSTDHYSNGVVMTAFKGMLYCMWQSSPTNEDSDDTWVAYSISTDEGTTWSVPRPLAQPTDSFYCTSGGWIVHGDTLTALIDTWEKGLEPRGGETRYITSTDGEHWSDMRPVMMANGKVMRGVLEQDPLRLTNGSLVGATHFQPGLHLCPVITSDCSGHSGWQRSAFEGKDQGKQSRELEPSQYIRPDSTLVMVFRDQSSSFHKLVSFSSNYGLSWTKPAVTAIPDARTKQCAGNLPDGRAFMVCCPVAKKQRWPLVLLLSNDGKMFDKTFLLRSGSATDLPPRQYEGKAKTLGYNYPKAFVHNGWLYVAYSTNKELVEFTKINIKHLPLQ